MFVKIVHKRFPHKIEVGHCIYCGATGNNLSKEHIVPKSLGGQFVLHKASCRQHRDITSEIELDVLHRTLLQTRAKMNLPTRHRHGRPKVFPLTIETEGRQETINIAIEKLPIFLPLLHFNLPAYIDKRHYEKGIKTIGVSGTGYVLIGIRLLKELSEQFKADSFVFRATYTGHNFARLLAKIAYGFAVAEFGADIIDNAYVLPSIKGLVNDIGQWTGCVDKMPAATNNLHQVRLSIKNGEIYAYIRLFAKFPVAPEYLVVVGRAPELKSSISSDSLFIC